MKNTRLSESEPKPERSDGAEWTSNQDLAAQHRATGKTWKEVADQMDLSFNTLKSYPSRYPRFQKLVDWYRNQFWRGQIEELTQELWPEALEALQDILRRRHATGDDQPKDRDLIQAAKAVLRNTGFKQAQDTRRKLHAQEDVSGTDEMSLKQQKLEQLDDEELDEEIEHFSETLEVVDGKDSTGTDD